MNVFLTGANRGLGLEFARQLAANGDRVFAAVRTASPAFQALTEQHANLSVVVVDVVDEDAVVAAAAAVAADVECVDVVINNAATNPKGLSLGGYSKRAMLDAFAVNAVAPVVVAQAFLPLLRKSPRGRLVNISTQVGSFSWNTAGRSPLYAASKAALNMMTRAIANEEKGVISVAVHPGWVQTDMGGKSAPLTPSESVTQLRALIDRLTPADSGSFFNVDGKLHPW